VQVAVEAEALAVLVELVKMAVVMEQLTIPQEGQEQSIQVVAVVVVVMIHRLVERAVTAVQV
jgi:hypothetical protein